jgi:poly(hydroxyalkanoate) depolymerase family esterase
MFFGRNESGTEPTHEAGGGAEAAPGGFSTFAYSNAAGTRSYRLHVPAGHSGARVPLVVMLHGGTQDAAAFAAATGMNALAGKFLVAYPEQVRSANAGQYWNWFVPGHQRRDAGEPSLIAGITRQVIARHGADATRVYVAGFSAGGAMAAVMAAVYPDLYAAVGVHSGLAYGSAADLASAFAAMKQGPARPPKPLAHPRPLIVFHGDQDSTVANANVPHLVDHALAMGLRDSRPATAPTVVSSSGQVPGGQAFTRTRYQDRTGAGLAERWIIHRGGHGWSGGAPNGSYTNPRGPNASAEFLRFFGEHPASALERLPAPRAANVSHGSDLWPYPRMRLRCALVAGVPPAREGRAVGSCTDAPSSRWLHASLRRVHVKNIPPGNRSSP